MTNALLRHADLPAFSDIQPSEVGSAVDALLADANAALDIAVSDATPASYDALSRVLDIPTERLGRAWGAVSHLSGVADTPELRSAYRDNLPKVTEFHTRMGADERLYAKYKALVGSPQAASLSASRRQALGNAMRDFVLAGAELTGESKARFQAIQERLATLSQQFSEHVLDATDRFSLIVGEEMVQGLPEDVKQAARAAAQAVDPTSAGYQLTLQFPSYLPVMQYAHERSLREQLYRAYVTRASELGPAELDNSALVQEIVALRHEEAQLLGYRSYAEVSLVPKMAESPEQVMGFLRDLAHRARP